MQRVLSRIKKLLLTTNNVTLEVRKVFKKYTCCVLFYMIVKLRQSLQWSSKLEVFEIWGYRKILQIKWIEGITNKALLDRIKEGREFWYTIKGRKDKIIGHLLRHDSTTKSVIEDDNENHIGRGRPKME